MGNVGVLGLPAMGGAGNSHVTPNHPLLMGRQVNTAGQTGTDSGASRGIAAGGQRTLQRHRGFRGYINLNSRSHTGNPTAPAILQNLVGSNPQDLITQGLRRGTPLLVDFGFAILDSLENEIPDLSDGMLGAGVRAGKARKVRLDLEPRSGGLDITAKSLSMPRLLHWITNKLPLK